MIPKEHRDLYLDVANPTFNRTTGERHINHTKYELLEERLKANPQNILTQPIYVWSNFSKLCTHQESDEFLDLDINFRNSDINSTYRAGNPFGARPMAIVSEREVIAHPLASRRN